MTANFETHFTARQSGSCGKMDFCFGLQRFGVEFQEALLFQRDTHPGIARLVPHDELCVLAPSPGSM